MFAEYEDLIEGAFLPALINGDTSGLSDDDVTALDRFLARLPAGAGHWAVDDEDAGFGRGVVTGLGSDRWRCTYMVRKAH
jgi:hypothetical protein